MKDFANVQEVYDKITLEDCAKMNEQYGTTFVISDGRITDIIRKGNENVSFNGKSCKRKRHY
jgi:hypothetical protein